MKTMIFDCPNLCHRAFHTIKYLHNNELETALIGRFLMDWFRLHQRYDLKRYAFCFDCGESHRITVYPEYKSARKSKDNHDDARPRQELYRAMRRIRDEILPRLGFKNVLWRDCHEADDLIASAVLNNKCRFIVVSSDKDLWQLISEKVKIYNLTTKSIFGLSSFTHMFPGITPDMWPWVKAIAGDPSDSIPGVKGVGEKGACNYLAGRLPKHDRFRKMIEADLELVEKFHSITVLPYVSTPKVKLQEDEFNPEEWNKIIKEVGLKSANFRMTV